MQVENRIICASKHTPGEIKCSFFDHIYRNTSVPVVFFYKKSVEKEYLIRSFEHVLNDFPVYAGRLKAVDGQYVIDCNNKGVSFSSEQLPISLSELLEKFPEYKMKLNDFINPEEAHKGQAPVFTITVKYLSCGGMSLGFCWHHFLGDLHSFNLFLQAFANTVEEKEYTKPLGITNRHTYLLEKITKNNNSLPAYFILKIGKFLQLLFYLLFTGKKKQTIFFYFSDSELTAMKSHFSRQSTLNLSTNDILSAYLEKTLAAVEKRKKERFLSLAVNFRKIEELPQNLCGNYICSHYTLCKPEDSTVKTAEELRKGLNTYKEHYGNYQVLTNFIRDEAGQKKIDRLIPLPFDPANGNIIITNWNKFNYSLISLKKNKPLFFSVTGEAAINWVITILQGIDEKGLIITITLPDSIAKKMQKTDTLEKLHRFRKERDQTVNAQMPWLL